MPLKPQCFAIYSINNWFTRVCQPRPVERMASTTSRFSLILTGIFASALTDIPRRTTTPSFLTNSRNKVKNHAPY